MNSTHQHSILGASYFVLYRKQITNISIICGKQWLYSLLFEWVVVDYLNDNLVISAFPELKLPIE